MTSATYRYLAAVVALGGVAPLACEKKSAEPPEKDDTVVEMAGKEPSRPARSLEGSVREDRGSRDPAPPAPPAEVTAGHQTPDSGGEAHPKDARHSVVEIAGEKYSLLFERDDLSAELQNTIVADINLILSPLEPVTFTPIPEAQVEKYQETVTHWWPYKARRNTGFPKVMRRYFGGAVKVDNEYKLVIHEKLIQAYEEALEFKKKHPAMFTKLDEFLALLQDREELAKLAEDPRAAEEITCFYGRARPPIEELCKGLSKFVDSLDIIRPPSLLEIKPLGESEWVEDPSMNDVFAFSCPLGDPGKVNPDVINYPLGAYKDGEWHFLFIRWKGP